MKKNHINLFTPSLFTWSIYEIIYAALFKDYRVNYPVVPVLSTMPVPIHLALKNFQF